MNLIEEVDLRVGMEELISSSQQRVSKHRPATPPSLPSIIEEIELFASDAHYIGVLLEELRQECFNPYINKIGG